MSPPPPLSLFVHLFLRFGKNGAPPNDDDDEDKIYDDVNDESAAKRERESERARHSLGPFKAEFRRHVAALD